MPGKKPSGTLLQHLVGLAIIPIIALFIGAGWFWFIINTNSPIAQALVPERDLYQFVLRATVFGILVWLPVWYVYSYFKGNMSPGTALLIGFALGIIAALSISDLDSFTMNGYTPLLAWAVVATAMFGAWVHSLMLGQSDRARTFGAYVVGLALFPIISFAITFGWLALTDLLGYSVEKWILWAFLAAAFSFVFGLLFWVPVSIFHNFRFGEMTSLKVISLGFVVATLILFIWPGESVFAERVNRVGWFIAASVAMSCWVNNKLVIFINR